MSKNISLQRLLKDADVRVKKAAAEALNEAAEELQNQIKNNMSAQGIKQDSGALVGSVKFTKATEKRPSVKIYSEVYKPLPKRPNSRRRKWGKPSIRYPSQGVPYGRIIEFSPRINRPFFYTAWYGKRREISEKVISAIGRAWSNE